MSITLWHTCCPWAVTSTRIRVASSGTNSMCSNPATSMVGASTESEMVRHAGQLMGDVGQDAIDRPGLAEPRLDRRRRSGCATVFEQQVPRSSGTPGLSGSARPTDGVARRTRSPRVLPGCGAPSPMTARTHHVRRASGRTRARRGRCIPGSARPGVGCGETAFGEVSAVVSGRDGLPGHHACQYTVWATRRPSLRWRCGASSAATGPGVPPSPTCRGRSCRISRRSAPRGCSPRFPGG